MEGEKESVLPFAIYWGGVNRGGIHIKKRQQGGVVVKRDVDPYIIRVGIKRRKRGGRKFRKGWALPDENDNAATIVRGIRRENARLGVGVIRAHSRESGIRRENARLGVGAIRVHSRESRKRKMSLDWIPGYR